MLLINYNVIISNINFTFGGFGLFSSLHASSDSRHDLHTSNDLSLMPRGDNRSWEIECLSSSEKWGKRWLTLYCASKRSLKLEDWEYFKAVKNEAGRWLNEKWENVRSTKVSQTQHTSWLRRSAFFAACTIAFFCTNVGGVGKSSAAFNASISSLETYLFLKSSTAYWNKWNSHLIIQYKIKHTMHFNWVLDHFQWIKNIKNKWIY